MEFLQLLDNGRGWRTLSKVHPNVYEAYDALFVNDDSGRMWHSLHRLAADVWVQKPVGLDGGTSVTQDGIRPIVFLEPACRLSRVILRNSEKDRASVFYRRFGVLQLTELLLAKWSPITAAKELENDGFVTPIARKRVRLSRRVFEREIRSRFPDLDTRLRPCERQDQQQQ